MFMVARFYMNNMMSRGQFHTLIFLTWFLSEFSGFIYTGKQNNESKLHGWHSYIYIYIYKYIYIYIYIYIL